MYEKALMQEEEIQVIEKQLLILGKSNEKLNILEWGSGKSTLYFTSFLKKNNIAYEWLSIEYNKQWHSRVVKMLKGDKNTEVILFDAGNAEARQRYTNMDEYVAYPKTTQKKFDLIFVDGRKRRRCLIEARKLLNPNGVVFLHDAHRKFYHCAFRYYPNSFLSEPRLWQGRKEKLSFPQKFNIGIINFVYFPFTKVRNLIARGYLKNHFLQNLKKSVSGKIRAINLFDMKIYKSKRELINDLIGENDIVLDVGFWGQAVGVGNKNWAHNILKSQAKEVFGVDINFDENKLENLKNYKKQSAENFDFEQKFDAIFAGDLIEHLSNLGLFLDSCHRNLKDGGKLILTTPNGFSLFNLVEKIFKKEPEVNNDHTIYFNFTVLEKLLEKNGWEMTKKMYLDDAWPKYKQSVKRKVLYGIFKILSLFTPKYIETIVVVAEKNTSQ